MPYHTLDEWLKLLTVYRHTPLDVHTPGVWLHQILCDFEELGYPDDNHLEAPLVLRFKAWCLSCKNRGYLSHHTVTKIIQDGDHYQRIGDFAVWLSEKLGLPVLHPGYAPEMPFAKARTAEFQMVQRLATWQTAESHLAWLHANAWGWADQAAGLGLAAAWPLFLHYQQWGVTPSYPSKNMANQRLGQDPLWINLPAEVCFVMWCLHRQSAFKPVTARSWKTWVSHLPCDHAAHMLDIPRAFQAYDLWASVHAAGQPPNWLSLLQMLEPAPVVAPAEIGPVADLAL